MNFSVTAAAPLGVGTAGRVIAPPVWSAAAVVVLRTVPLTLMTTLSFEQKSDALPEELPLVLWVQAPGVRVKVVAAAVPVFLKV